MEKSRGLLEAVDRATAEKDVLDTLAFLIATSTDGVDMRQMGGLSEELNRAADTIEELVAAIKGGIHANPDGSGPKVAEAVCLLISRAQGAANILADMCDSPQYDESTTRAFSFIGDGLLEAATAAESAVNG